ncbi:MAG: hypothetical protein A3C70_01660 [Candidatus Zambryskibacteria bacterium RIFCSPHIGHO2_02_FULL_43_14]|uniref:VanZ-like domain-containing protein n=1 Tax=Candidatus Zambryskibacteria bacterium RIFCSPHIGHO2_02_FULL_43_14 TaxID=1802748 RepID=A0A1G2TK06_9BACT|nr:MAG: hypothetical protein A2829_01485 [Candidatus Zambryskibacteria bacterium RIFCSPHIGHO2_01_FULL_43_60]OHA96951.1 MAG: hypothetical protein A3C70_01660 [Candidatus Zambryskibacteria bacterium RIFCSPHIGHO2_02_FULL_43_14]OHB03973.1 MAG: hypothetical protein A3B03_00725 [Candidatus Zambryskibacteria bacterium RIFCSPLOWO2_01_FULL_42_41]
MDIWKHGKYLDLWSLVHFLSGFILCGFFYWLGLSFFWTSIYSIVLLVLWEIFEFFIEIIEPSVNVAVDIAVGLLGFFSATWLYFFRTEFDASFYLTAVGATFILSLWGFLDFFRKGYR